MAFFNSNFYFKTLLIVIITPYLTSCTSISNDTYSSKREISLQVSDSICIQLDSNSITRSSAMFYFKEKAGKFLAMENRLKSRIEIYDLEKKSHSQNIPIFRKGKNSIPYNTGFHIISRDSLLIPTESGELFLINSIGELIDRISYMPLNANLTTTDRLPMNASSWFSNQIIESNNKFYGLQINGTIHYKEEYPDNYFFCYEIDLLKRKIDPMPIRYPKSYWEEGVKDLGLSWTHNGIDFIYSPTNSHYIYLSRDNNKIDQKILVQSSEFSTFLSDYNSLKGLSSDLYWCNIFESGMYNGIVYDEYREVYYRFFRKPIPFEDVEITEDFILYPSNSGIMIIDKDFNVLSEINLPDNVYGIHHYFVDEYGLYIATNHPKKLSLYEDELCFHLFTMSKVD